MRFINFFTLFLSKDSALHIDEGEFMIGFEFGDCGWGVENGFVILFLDKLLLFSCIELLFLLELLMLVFVILLEVLCFNEDRKLVFLNAFISSQLQISNLFCC